MDWSRAKLILIATFLILNIFLFANIVMDVLPGSIPDKVIDDSVKILANRGVTFSPGYKIPSTSGKFPMLEFTAGDFNKDNLIQKLLGNDTIYKSDSVKYGEILSKYNKKLVFESPGVFVFNDDNPPGGIFNISDQDELDRQLRDYLNGLGIGISGFVLDSVFNETSEAGTEAGTEASSGSGSGDTVCIFIQKYRNFMVFDNFIRISISRGSVSRLECSIRKVHGFSKNSVNILPAHQILLLNDFKITSDEPDTDVFMISGIDFGFKGYDSGQNETPLMEFSESPAWRIIINGNPRYFKAYNGEEIK